MWYNQKTKKKEKKKKLNDVSIRLPHELNQQFFPLCLLCMLHQFLDWKKSLDFFFRIA